MGFYSKRGNMRNNMMRDNMMRDNMMRDKMNRGNMMRDNMKYKSNFMMRSNKMGHGSTCSSNNDCDDQWFCNFEDENTGYCQTCSSINHCENESFSKHGMVSCMQRCDYHDKYDTMTSDSKFMMGSNSMRPESSCTSNGDCSGDEWFCDFQYENTGYCRDCSSVSDCETYGFTSKHGQISCMQTCEYHDKNNGMNDMGFYGNSMRNNMGNNMMQGSMMRNSMMQDSV